MTRMNKALLAVTAVLGSYAAATTMADIVGTAHDFSPFGWSQGRICLPCHIPHHADTSVDDAPLWNHELTTATYTIYDGTTGVPTEDALDGRSILCMSCHDGTVALDSFGGNTGVQYIGSAGLIGTDLTDDHPVGATAVYPDVPWFNDPVNWEDNPHGFTLQDMDINGTIERVVSCTTCHEPHDRHSQQHMLWINNSGSALCLTCHLK
ncbi:MAG: cytochrome c3 family protein [Phycisphaerales bacterium JB038]